MSNISDLYTYIDRLLRAGENDSAFLTIAVTGTEDFLQLIAESESVQLDFPLLTGRQMSFESQVRAIAEIEDYTVVENRGDDGSRFLDIDLPFSTAEVTRVCYVFLEELFDVGPGAQLEFEGDCLETSH